MYQYKYDNFHKYVPHIDPNKITYINENISKDTSFKYDQNELYDDGYIYSKYYDYKEPDNDGPFFDYQINKDGFRSQHFENFNDKDINIVTFGCSFTAGIGLPEEYIWPSILTEMIKNDHPNENVQLYNMGVSGSGIELIFKNFVAFLQKYSSINYVFILFPGFDRKTIATDFSQNNQAFIKATYCRPTDEPFLTNKTIKDFVLGYNQNTEMLTQLSMIRAIEHLCKSLGITLRWGSYIQSNQKIYETFYFENLVKVQHCNNLQNYVDHEYLEVARDMTHPGLVYNGIIATQFYEALEN